MSAQRLAGKTAIVTGGGVGIGRGISERLTEERARATPLTVSTKPD